MAQEEEKYSASAGAESKFNNNPNLLSSVFHQAANKGNFRWEQKEDGCPKLCWGQVLQVQRLCPSHTSYYNQMEHQQQACNLLVVPRTIKSTCT